MNEQLVFASTNLAAALFDAEPFLNKGYTFNRVRYPSFDFRVFEIVIDAPEEVGNIHVGSSFDSFLVDQGITEAVANEVEKKLTPAQERMAKARAARGNK